MLEDLGDPVADSALVGHDHGFWELAAKGHSELRVGVSELDGANTALRPRDEEASERRVGDVITDGHAAAALAVGGGRHAELLAGRLVEAAAGAVAGVVEGACDGVTISKAALQALEPASFGVLARGDAEGALEHALELTGVHTEAAADLRQAERFVFVEGRAGLPYERGRGG